MGFLNFIKRNTRRGLIFLNSNFPFLTRSKSFISKKLYTLTLKKNISRGIFVFLLGVTSLPMIYHIGPFVTTKTMSIMMHLFPSFAHSQKIIFEGGCQIVSYCFQTLPPLVISSIYAEKITQVLFICFSSNERHKKLLANPAIRALGDIKMRYLTTMQGLLYGQNNSNTPLGELPEDVIFNLSTFLDFEKSVSRAFFNKHKRFQNFVSVDLTESDDSPDFKERLQELHNENYNICISKHSKKPLKTICFTDYCKRYYDNYPFDKNSSAIISLQDAMPEKVREQKHSHSRVSLHTS